MNTKIIDKDFTGERAGYLTALFKSGVMTLDGKFMLWIAKCHRCGRIALVSASKLHIKRKDSDCGCSKIDRLRHQIKDIESDWATQDVTISAFYEGRGVDKPECGPNPSDTNLEIALVGGIRLAAEEDRPFRKTGKNGVYERRQELPPQFHIIGRDRLQMMVAKLIDRGAIVNSRKKLLDVPGGALSGGRR